MAKVIETATQYRGVYVTCEEDGLHVLNTDAGDERVIGYTYPTDEQIRQFVASL